MSKQNSKTTAVLLAEYAELDGIRQRILQISALSYYVISHHYYYGGIHYPYSTLRKNLLKQLASENKGKALSDNEFSQILQSLCKSGFLNHEYRIRRGLLFPLCKLAANSENNKINLPLILSQEHFNLTPEFDSYAKLDAQSYQSLDFEDYRSLNLAIHANLPQIFQQEWDEVAQTKILTGYRFLFYNFTPDEEWLNSRLKIFQLILCVTNLSYDLGLNIDENPQREYWRALLDTFDNNLPLAELKSLPLLNVQLNQLYLVLHKHQQIDKVANRWAAYFITATASLLNGENTTALKEYELSIRGFSQICKRDNWFYLPEASLLYAISLIREQKTAKLTSSIIKRLEKQSNLYSLALALNGIYSILNNDLSHAKHCLNTLEKKFSEAKVNLADLNSYAIYVWLATLIAPQNVKWATVKNHLSTADELKAVLSKTILAELILQQDGKFELSNKILAKSYYRGLQISNLIQVKAGWEYSIDKLSELLGESNNKPANQPLKDKRLVWFIDPLAQQVRVVEQSLRKNGQWTVGKEVSLTRLYKRSELEYLETYDNAACLAILPHPYHSGYFVWDFAKLLLKLVGHPLVFDYNHPEIAIELINESPLLEIMPSSEGYSLRLSHQAPEDGSVHVNKISVSKYQLIEFTPKLMQLAEFLGKGLLLPEAAKTRLLNIACKTIPDLKINAAISDKDLIESPAKSNPIVQLTPASDGLILNLLVKPFANDNYYFPGSGLANQMGLDEKQQPIKLVRDFKAELKFVRHLQENCPLLKVAKLGEFEWQYDDLEQSLELLSELHAYKEQHSLLIEWPKGESLKFAANLSNSSLKLKVKSQQQWFEYSGEVTIEDDQVLELKKLLAYLDSNSNSRFVQLDDGKFIALTRNLQRQLNQLKLLSEGNKISSLGSSVLAELVDDSEEAKVDKKWLAHIANLEERAKFIPQLPSTLQAELRDYQVDGFNYLARLSNWKIGACLADDMGLGKTIQAIALLLEQATNGASLVIAPTSVCFNWQEELAKFAPSLNVFLMHNEQERSQLIERIGARDVLICSYGLLQQDENGLMNKEWNLVILDEAQAIKNSTTKRFKAACQLNSQRRIILSGTPIENHLGELWSLFRFLNPGLLGSLDKFQKNFVTPISNKNQLAKQTLKNLLQPYILRRTKTEVLSELPPKIEQSIYIQPSSDEMAFYEAIRQKALANLANLKEDEKQRFSILAEITRLRQACCHSSLVDPTIQLENSKLAAFLELVHELIANRHKVLVFSQYVGYLAIVQQILQENSISYQYIDGSTPINQRKIAVNHFQSGKGDVFLISLKAGGTGLNLTAADYVIILDPWWNPAVEDQAADRAHRMGQQRPVTVYRLIMKNSIEEKIIQMHKDKRDLAGDLLSGQDVSSKLSQDDLLNLIKI